MNTDDDLPRGLPEHFNLQRADDGETVETDDGRLFRVVVSRRDHSKRALVHEDVANYGQFDHPAASGALGGVILAAALLTPVLFGLIGVDLFALAPGPAFLFGSVCCGAGVWAFNVLLGGVVGDMIARFEEWHEHQELVAGRDYGAEGGETA